MSPDEPSTTRRALIAATGATALGGCVGGLPAGGTTDETTTETTTTVADDDSADWPQMGRNAAHDGYAPEFAAETDPAVAWEIEVDGSLTTPTVVGDAVYVTRGAPTEDGPEATLEAYAVDSGERRWSRSLGTEFEYNAPFSNHRPVVHDGTIYATTTDELVAVDAETRDVRWRVETDAFTNAPPTACTRGRGRPCSPSTTPVTSAGDTPSRASGDFNR